MQILIHIPNSFLPERTYILNTFFNEFLGLDYRIDIQTDIHFYKIILPNQKVLLIEDCFFGRFKDENYLFEEALPKLIVKVENRFAIEKDLALIYGNSRFEMLDNQIVCGYDIFASAFFMLSRWEEYVNKERDSHNRFPCEKSFVQGQHLHYRPLVNEYCEFLWNVLQFLGYEGKRKTIAFELVPTHDIDFFERYDSFSKFARALIGDLVKRKSLGLMFETFRDYLQIRFGLKKDSYDTFDFLQESSEKLGVQSHFYFLIDENYQLTKKVQSKILKIIDRGHLVGIHGNYASYNDKSIFESNLKRLQKVCSVAENRQHFLRFENPLTWQILESLGIEKDSTMGFSNDGGFRCGTCYEFPIFDILNRKTLKIKEMPLIVMETALRKKHPDYQSFTSSFLTLKETVKKYKGKFVFLWHNSNLRIHEWKNGEKRYENLL